MFEWLFGEHRAELRGWKTIRLRGRRYVIRKLNPILDFQLDRMPMIFSAYAPTKVAQGKAAEALNLRRIQEEMMEVVRVGVVEPQLTPVAAGDGRGREPGITVEDLFRDPEIGAALYQEIIIHTWNRYQGLRGVFFSAATRRAFHTGRRRTMESAPAA